MPILLFSQWLLAKGAPIHKTDAKMARELILVFSDEAPIRILSQLGPLYVLPADFSAAEFEPKHFICLV